MTAICSRASAREKSCSLLSLFRFTHLSTTKRRDSTPRRLPCPSFHHRCLDTEPPTREHYTATASPKHSHTSLLYLRAQQGNDAACVWFSYAHDLGYHTVLLLANGRMCELAEIKDLNAACETCGLLQGVPILSRHRSQTVIGVSSFNGPVTRFSSKEPTDPVKDSLTDARLETEVVSLDLNDLHAVSEIRCQV